MEKLDIEVFKPKFGEWWRYFEPLFRDTTIMEQIYSQLKSIGFSGATICPEPKNTFRVFTSVPPDKLKAIFVLLDPYPSVKAGKVVATGVAMDCSNTGELQPSLEKFYEGIEETYCKGEMCLEMLKLPSLEYLTEQGIMFFNTALTVEKGKTGSHTELWEPFMKYFYEEVMRNFTGIPYVLCGKDSHKMEKWIDPLANFIYKIEHPSAACRQYRPWKHDSVFKKIDYILKSNTGEKINWILEPAPF